MYEFSRLLYMIGIQTVRILHRMRRRLSRFFMPASALFFRVCYQLFGRPYHWVREECAYLRRAFGQSAARLRSLRDSEPIHYKGERAWFRKRVLAQAGRILGGVFNVAAPVAAILLLVHTVRYWTGLNYGLKLNYEGQTIGLVENEGSVGDVVNMVTERMATDQVSAAAVTPTYELTTVSRTDHFTSYNALCDTLVSGTNGQVEAATGLYVDNEFVGAVRSRTDLRYILQSILRQSESEDGALSAAFVQDVELADGMYAPGVILTSEEMNAKLTGTQEVQQTYTVKSGDAPLSIAAKLGMTLSDLQSLNRDVDMENGSIHEGDKLVISAEKGFFTIKQVKHETYTKSIDYDTVSEKTSNLYIGSSRVVTDGQYGEETVTDEVTYVDGVEVDRKNLTATVTKQPVTKVVQVGTAMRQTTYYAPQPSGSTGSSGTFMWPMPASRTISDGYGYTNGRFHGAIDIQCSYATVVAADSGYVTQAGWDAGYGWNILVTHDNGLQTFYAHCSSLLASAGTYVSKGQAIAVSGSTGYWSTGPHLHFEVRLNGVKVNPWSYL